MDLRKKTHDKFVKLANEIDSDGILDHEILALERIMVERRKAERVANSHRYKIHKTQKNDLDINQGYTFVYRLGASIYYSPKGTRLQKMIAVGHELGHIYLGHVDVDVTGLPNNTTRVVNLVHESEASYFAKLIIARRTNQYSDTKWVNERIYSPSDIEVAILKIQPDYDETLLNTA